MHITAYEEPPSPDAGSSRSTSEAHIDVGELHQQLARNRSNSRDSSSPSSGRGAEAAYHYRQREEHLDVPYEHVGYPARDAAAGKRVHCCGPRTCQGPVNGQRPRQPSQPFALVARARASCSSACSRAWRASWSVRDWQTLHSLPGAAPVLHSSSGGVDLAPALGAGPCRGLPAPALLFPFPFLALACGLRGRTALLLAGGVGAGVVGVVQGVGEGLQPSRP